MVRNRPEVAVSVELAKLTPTSRIATSAKREWILGHTRAFTTSARQPLTAAVVPDFAGAAIETGSGGAGRTGPRRHRWLKR
jgi:hypothetical protein